MRSTTQQARPRYLVSYSTPGTALEKTSNYEINIASIFERNASSLLESLIRNIVACGELATSAQDDDPSVQVFE